MEGLKIAHNIPGHGTDQTIQIHTRERFSLGYGDWFMNPLQADTGKTWLGREAEPRNARLASQLFMVPGVEKVRIQQHDITLSIGAAFAHEAVEAEAVAALEVFLGAEAACS